MSRTRRASPARKEAKRKREEGKGQAKLQRQADRAQRRPPSRACPVDGCACHLAQAVS